MGVKVVNTNDGNFSLKEEIFALITGVLILIIALAWNETAKSAFNKVFHGSALLGQFLYAAILSVVILLILHFLLKYLRNQQPDCSEVCKVQKIVDEALQPKEPPVAQ